MTPQSAATIEVYPPSHTVGLDLVGSFWTSRGYKYIIVAINYRTKFSDTKPVQNIKAVMV